MPFGDYGYGYVVEAVAALWRSRLEPNASKLLYDGMKRYAASRVTGQNSCAGSGPAVMIDSSAPAGLRQTVAARAGRFVCCSNRIVVQSTWAGAEDLSPGWGRCSVVNCRLANKGV